MKRVVTEKNLEAIRWYLIENIMRDPDTMHSEERAYRATHNKPDLIEVIASLYEVLHQVVLQEPYGYMFHHANKCGSWVEGDLFDHCISIIVGEDVKQ